MGRNIRSDFIVGRILHAESLMMTESKAGTYRLRVLGMMLTLGAPSAISSVGRFEETGISFSTAPDGTAKKTSLEDEILGKSVFVQRLVPHHLRHSFPQLDSQMLSWLYTRAWLKVDPCQPREAFAEKHQPFWD